MKNEIIKQINSFISHGLSLEDLTKQYGTPKESSNPNSVVDGYWKEFENFRINFNRENIAKVIVFRKYFGLNSRMITKNIIEMFGNSYEIYSGTDNSCDLPMLYYKFDNCSLALNYTNSGSLNNINEFIDKEITFFSIVL